MQRFFLLMVLSALLAGCGSGGSGDNASQPWIGAKPPTPPKNNTAPVFKADGTQFFLFHGAMFEMSFSVDDAEEDILTVSMSGAPSWLKISHDANSKTYKIHGTPDKLGVYNPISVVASDGKLTTKMELSLTVVVPSSVILNIPLERGLSKSDSVSIKEANSNKVISTGVFDDVTDAFKIPLPINDETKRANLLVSWGRLGGYTEYIKWIGDGKSILMYMGDTLSLPNEIAEEMIPDAKSTAYVHMLTQYGALDPGSDIASWSSMAAHAIKPSTLKSIAIYYDLAWSVPDLFVLNDVLAKDKLNKYLHPENHRVIFENVNDARLKVQSLVGIQYWTELLDKHEKKLFEKSSKWKAGEWAVTYPSGLNYASTDGFIVAIGENGICSLQGESSTCSSDDNWLHVTSNKTVYGHSSATGIMKKLTDRGVITADAEEISKQAYASNKTIFKIEESFTDLRLKSILWTNDGRSPLEVFAEGTLSIPELNVYGVKFSGSRYMIAQPVASKALRHWTYKPEIFDLITFFPDQNLEVGNANYWIDMFRPQNISFLDSESSLKTGNITWLSSDWKSSYNPDSRELLFEKDDVSWMLTLIDESSPHYDHMDDIHGRQYGFSGTLKKSGVTLWKGVVPGVLYPKARCEISPLTPSFCSPDKLVDSSDSTVWLDSELGRQSPLDFEKYLSGYQTKKSDAGSLSISMKSMHLCNKKSFDAKCLLEAEVWQLSTNKNEPGIWRLKNEDPNKSLIWMVVKFNNGDLSYVDLQSMQLKHLEQVIIKQ